MAISDRRKIAAVLVLAAGGIGLVGVSSGATFTSTVTGSFTVEADFPPTPTATATVTAEPTVSAPGTPTDPGTGSTAPSDPGSATPTPTPPPTPTATATKTARLTTVALNSSDWFTSAAPVFTYKNKEIEFTGTAARMIGGFTAQNTGDIGLSVTVTVSLPSDLVGKVTAEVRLVKGTAVLKAAADQHGESAGYELWLTPKKSGDRISKDHAKDIRLTFAHTTG
ncbi:hypothetical protein AB8A21_35070 [Streptomyces sp. BF23-18]|uniref:hypothetical protein n=1 Tax=Streptomyces sp. BF23-18 TaxID=3240282 RepID=UPI0034E3B853